MEVDEPELLQAYKSTAREAAGAPSYDLKRYSSQYKGPTKHLRLYDMADKLPAVRLEALLLAIDTVKQETKDTGRYRTYTDRLSSLDPSNQHGSFDREWYDKTTRDNEEEFARLDAGLRAANKDGQIESYEKAYQDLTEYYINIGNFGLAQRNILKQGDVMPRNRKESSVVELAKVGMLQNALAYVRSLLAKPAHAVASSTNSEFTQAEAYTVAIHGVALMAGSSFAEAAGTFLSIPNDKDQVENMRNLATPTDFGVYTAVCALATLSRPDLKYLAQKDVLFSAFCDQAPYLREMVLAYVQVNYKTFFKIWKTHYSDFCADMYIGPHMPELCKMIRKRALTQYLQAYSKVGLQEMADAFDESVDELIEQLRTLILSQGLQARIDVANGVVQYKPETSTDKVFQESKSLADAYCSEARVLCWVNDLAYRGNRQSA